MPELRPHLTPAIERVLALLCAHEELSGIDAGSVLVVAHGAHGTAAASVRALAGHARACVVDGRRRHIELCLRPAFFLDGDAPRRLATLAHELSHVDRRTPGALAEANRHRRRTHASLERDARRIAADLLGRPDPTPFLCLAHDGEVMMRSWRHRPIEATHTRRFTDRDVFDTPVVMRTPKAARGGWW